MAYSETFRQRMVSKMSGPGGISASALAEEVDVDQTTLSLWLRKATNMVGMGKKKPKEPRRPQDWTAEEKLQVVEEARDLSDEALGAFLREKGLYESQLEEWRNKAEQGARAALSGSGDTKARKSNSRRIRELERELRRKDKALAETAALLILKKKLAALWEDEDDATKPNNEE